MPQQVDVADWKDVWNVRQTRYEDMVFTRIDGSFKKVRSQRVL
jgi:hypothetical protein